MLNDTNMSTLNISMSESFPLRHELYICMGVVLLLTGIFGALLNGVVIAIIKLTSSLSGPTYQLLEALCWSQMLVSLMGNPLSSAAAFSKKWIFGNGGCSYYGFMMTVLGLFSINILSAISVERYICICLPSKKTILSSRFSKIVIGLCFLISLLWGIFPLVGWSKYDKDGIGIGCCPTLNTRPGAYSYIIAMMVLEAFLPMNIIAFCYGSIFREVHRSSKAIGQHTGGKDVQKAMMKKEKKVAGTIALSIGMYFLAWGPYTVTSIIYTADPDHLDPITITISAFIAKCSTIWNPIVFVVTNTKFRQAFLQIVLRRQVSINDSIQDDESMAKSSRQRTTGQIDTHATNDNS